MSIPENISTENVFEEIYGNKSSYILSFKEKKKVEIYSKDLRKKSIKNILNKFFDVLKTIFLPEGFPESVSKDYISYQIWDTLQAFSSTITGTLSTHAILAGVGVGNEAATPLSATITWILKDGTGHIGRIIFAWWKGSDLDVNSKRWRLIADILNDLALGIEVLLLPLYHTWSTEILCLTTAIKSVVGVAGGATRVALTQHHASRGNLADVTAKDGSQETFVNLCASMLAVLILMTISSKIMILFWFILFTMLHLYANYKAVKTISLKVLNTSRFLSVCLTYMNTENILAVEDANANEPVLFPSIKDYHVCGHKIEIGKSIRNVIQDDDLQNLKQVLSVYKNKEYFIYATDNVIYIGLTKTHLSVNVLEAYFHALVVGVMMLNNKSQENNKILVQNLLATCGIDVRLSYKDIFDQSCVAWNKLKTALENKGWTTEQHLLSVGEYRVKW